MSKGSTYLRYSDPFWESPEVLDTDADGASAPAHAAQVVSSPIDFSSDVQELPELPTIDLHNVIIHAVSEAEAVQRVLDLLDRGRGGVVVTPNLDHLRRCARDVHFAALVAEADLVTADGMPLVWASRLQGTPLPERVAGSNLISSLSKAAAIAGRSLYLLGGAPGTAEGAAKVLTERYPGLIIAGTYCPPMGFERDTRVLGDLSNRLDAAKPDIVFVALGSPKQELLINHLRTILPRGWWLGVGNSFSFLCGHVRRAPLWMQKWGLEWVHRLGQEPKRLFKRYVLVGIPFGMRMMHKAGRRRVIRILSGQPYGITQPSDYRPLTEHLRSPAVHDANPMQIGLARAAETMLHAVGQSLSQGMDWSQPAAGPSMVAMRSSSSAGEPVAAAVAGVTRPGSRLSSLKALILLGGAVRPTEPASATERSLLDLPLDEAGSLLNFWLKQATEVARVVGMPSLPVRIMVNRGSAEPISGHPQYIGTYAVERDRSDFRGTGGVLRDLAERYDDEDVILVANAAQVLLDPLSSLVMALDRKGADLSVVSHDDGTPSGVMLISCKTLRTVPSMGYVDMKEQALPAIASQFDVRVVAFRHPTGLPVRTLEDYIQALRFHHCRLARKTAFADPLAEDWNSTFSLIEEGAQVDPNARVHDSVVLAGGIVRAGAVVVRSVVCPGGIVKTDEVVVDDFVTEPGKPVWEKADRVNRDRDGSGSGPARTAHEASRDVSCVPVVAPAALSALQPGGIGSLMR